jgi:hypothetical protein
MATLAEPEQFSREPIQTVFETQSVMQRALGRELSESEAMVLGFELLEFLDALTGDDDGFRESC